MNHLAERITCMVWHPIRCLVQTRQQSMQIQSLRALTIEASLKLHYWRQQRQQHKQNIPICDQLIKATSVLICLPPEKIGVETVMNSVHGLRQIFPNAQIALLNSSKYSLADYIINDFSIIELDESHITKWGSLDKSSQALLFKHPFDIVIDLSKAFHYLNTLVACSSRAKLRIGFGHPKRNDYYNFVIRLRPNQNWKRSLATLYRYLSLGAPVYA
ncbi:MAG TPA: hypothetical protein PKW76_09265 [bacterium]|nr:hypothetical protein [bacterium]HPG45858.1 hypothetical protein [bacterium]HPM97915.1 hypothetical protein [bacterium]